MIMESKIIKIKVVFKNTGTVSQERTSQESLQTYKFTRGDLESDGVEIMDSRRILRQSTPSIALSVVDLSTHTLDVAYSNI